MKRKGRVFVVKHTGIVKSIIKGEDVGRWRGEPYPHWKNGRKGEVQGNRGLRV